MRKDHYSTKKYYENGEGKEIKPSMGEVINLVSHGVLNDEAFEVTAKGAEVDRLDRLAVLFDLFLNVPHVCSTGLSNEFLFVVDGYRGVRIIELLSGFINNLALIFVAQHLREDYQEDSQALYTLVLGHFSDSNTHYEAWLSSKKEVLQAYLEGKVSLLKLNKAACDKAVVDFMGALDYVDMPTDLNQPVISAMAYFFNDHALNKNLKTLPGVLNAVIRLRSVFEGFKSLEDVVAFGVLDFYRAIELIQECVHFQKKHCLISGTEVGKTQTSLARLMLLLLSYFQQVSVSTLTPEQLILPKAIDQAAVIFHDDVRQYEFGHLIDFVKNFFALIGSQRPADQKSLFEKMEGYRDRLLLSDAQLRQWQERNINLETGELHISPYEINQFIFNALWVNLDDWSPEFRKVLNTVLEWLHDDSVRDGLKANVKIVYMDWGFLGALSLLLFMTRQGVPASVRQHFAGFYPAKMSLAERFEFLCGVPERFFFDKLGEDARPMQGEFFEALRKFDLRYGNIVHSMKDPQLTVEQRRSALNVLLDIDVVARGSDFGDTVYIRLLSVLRACINHVDERQRVLDVLYQTLDNHLVGHERSLISNHEFSLLSFAEKERFLLRCPEPRFLKDIFLQRSHLDPASHRHAVLTEKLKAALEAGEASKTEKFDFTWLLKALYGNEEAKLEWMRLHQKMLLSYFRHFDDMRSFMREHSYPVKVFFYECVLKGRLRVRPNNVSASSFKVFFHECPDLRDMVEAEIMQALEKNNDESIYPWAIDELYAALSEPRREALMRAWADGAFLTKGNVDDGDYRLGYFLGKIAAEKPWEQASQFLTKYSPKLLTAMMRYVFKPAHISLDSPFVIEFLPLSFANFFKVSSGGELRSYVFEISVLFLLFFHFRETFFLSDDVVNEFMRLHLENDSKSLRLSESEIACFVMHALHIPPRAWSVDFKAAFKVILDALKQHLADDKNTALRAPYCVPEFIYNLRGLWAVANLDIPDKLTDRFELLNLGLQSTGRYSAEYNLFTTAYAVNFLCRDDYECNPDDEAQRKAFFNLIQGELSHHIRSVSDVVRLLEIEWLSSEQRDAILDIALEKAGACALKMESYVYTHDSAFGQLPHLNDSQKKRVNQLLEIIHCFDSGKNRDYRFEDAHYSWSLPFYSSAMCFFVKKAAEPLKAKFQNTAIRVTLI